MGGKTPKGKARGECANVLPERDQNANQTHIGQSKAFRWNKTKMKTALYGRVQKIPNPDSSTGSLETIATGSESTIGVIQVGFLRQQELEERLSLEAARLGDGQQ